MNKLQIFRLLLVLIGSLSAAPAWAEFEGVIEMKVSGGDGQNPFGGTTTATFGKTGCKFRSHMGAGAMLMDSAMLFRYSEPNLAYLLDEKGKSYSVIDVKQAAASGIKDNAKYSVTKLGSEKVAGLSTKHVRVTGDNGREMEVWTLTDVAGDTWRKLMAQGPQKGQSDALMEALKSADADGFVAKMVDKDKTGRPTMTMEIVKFEKKTVPDSAFELPADYRKKEMGAMMGGGSLPPEVQEQMEKSMRNMTPEQREMIKKAMQQNGGKR